jgi:hypothetical protein
VIKKSLFVRTDRPRVQFACADERARERESERARERESERAIERKRERKKERKRERGREREREREKVGVLARTRGWVESDKSTLYLPYIEGRRYIKTSQPPDRGSVTASRYKVWEKQVKCQHNVNLTCSKCRGRRKVGV